MMAPVLTIPQIRAKMITILGDELGDYLRPGLSNTDAVWVADRPVPNNYKVVEASPPAALINALEVVIYFSADYINSGLNLRLRKLDELISCYLIFHDSRQNPQKAIGAILANFQVQGDFTHLPGTDLNPEQYSFRIINRYQVEELYI